MKFWINFKTVVYAGFFGGPSNILDVCFAGGAANILEVCFHGTGQKAPKFGVIFKKSALKLLKI